MTLLKTSDFDYHLPEHLIAQTPLERRDESRLLVVHRETGKIEHKHFFDLPNYLQSGDALVLNESRVLPARIYGQRIGTGARVEFLLLRRTHGDEWQGLTRPAKKAKVGDSFDFGHGLTATVTQEGEDGIRHFVFSYCGMFMEVLEKVGSMPLPPYIRQKLSDASRYQTVYARVDGSSAAPTAGLHFTPSMLQTLQDAGISVEKLLLHVGLGTFRPVAVQDIANHKMHSEWYELSPKTADHLNQIRAKGGKIFAVGTTTCRVLETLADGKRVLHAGSGETDIFIKPGHVFCGIDALITNFHLPQSTLLMLVSAKMGRDFALEVYAEAVAKEYRFFSFGDAMLIL